MYFKSQYIVLKSNKSTTFPINQGAAAHSHYPLHPYVLQRLPRPHAPLPPHQVPTAKAHRPIPPATGCDVTLSWALIYSAIRWPLTLLRPDWRMFMILVWPLATRFIFIIVG
jgi:hypothetical protein